MTHRANIACLGAGRMGRGIAVAFAYAGHTVTMIDVKARPPEDFARLEAHALGEVRKTFASLSKLGLLTDADVDPLFARVTVVPASESVPEQHASPDQLPVPVMAVPWTLRSQLSPEPGIVLTAAQRP